MANSKLNLLVAYPYAKKGVLDLLSRFDKEHPNTLRFFLDSGAFTAFNAGKVITLDEYCRFLESLPFKPWRYFMLDVIMNEEKTMANYEKMLERGFNPVPVYTYGQDPKAIEYYYSKSDYVALGGLVGVPKNVMLNEVKKFQKMVDGRKSHLLGFTQIKGIKFFKPYSCDSSTWSNGSRYGEAHLYCGNGEFLKLKRKHFITKPSDKIIKAIRSLGFNMEELKIKTAWQGSYNKISELTLASWVKMSLECEKHIKTKLFLAFSSKKDGERLIESYKKQTLNKVK